MAAIIPGLGVQDQYTSPGAPQVTPRPDVPSGDNIRTPMLTPTAQPVDTFMRPAEPVTQAQNLSRIADALSAFQPALANYSMTQHLVQHQQSQNAVSTLTGLDANGIRSALASNPDLQNEAAKRLGMQMLGQKQAEQDRADATKAYYDGTFDRSNGNFEEFINGYAQRALQGNANDPWFARGYSETFNVTKNALLGDQTKFQIDKSKMQQDDLLTSTFSNAITNGLAKGQDAKSIWSAIQQTMATNRTISNRPISEQQDVLMGTVQRLYTGLATDPNWDKLGPTLKDLLTMDRGTAPDGTKLGSLVSSSVVGGKASTLFQEITREMDSRYGSDTFGAVADVRELAKHGDNGYK